MTKGLGAFAVSRLKPTGGIVAASGSKSSDSTTTSKNEEVSEPSSNHSSSSQMTEASKPLCDGNKANNGREVLKRFSPGPTQSNSQTERGNQRLFNTERQSPPLCNVISPQTRSFQTGQALLAARMPSLYPSNDIGLNPDLFAKRTRLETILSINDPNDRLIKVLEFWEELGGLNTTGVPVAEIHFTGNEALDQKNSHQRKRTPAEAFNEMNVDCSKTTTKRQRQRTSEASDRMDIDDNTGARPIHSNEDVQPITDELAKQPSDYNLQLRPTNPASSTEETSPTFAGLSASDIVSIVSKDEDPGDEPPELLADTEDFDADLEEGLPITKLRYHIPRMVTLENERRDFHGRWLPCEREALGLRRGRLEEHATATVAMGGNVLVARAPPGKGTNYRWIPI